MSRNERTADNASMGENPGNTSEVKESTDAKISSGITSVPYRGTFVKFKSADGEVFQMEEKVAKMFRFDDETIERIIEDNQPILVTKINSDILILMLWWAQRHADDPEIDSDVDDDGLKRTDNLTKWDKKFLNDLDIVKLFRLTDAAKFAHMNGFLNILLKKLASMIKGKTPDEIRKTFNIPQDL